MNSELDMQRQYWDKEAHAFKKIYSNEKSRFMNFLDRVFRKDMYERFLFTIHHSHPIENRLFLDVGCGNGLYSVELAKKGAARVVGIDIAPTMIDLANGEAARAGVSDRCQFLETDLLQYNPEQAFDVTIGIGLFDYIQDPIPVLSKMKKVSKDKVIGAFPRLWTWRAPIRKIRLTVKGCPVYFYSRKKLERLMREAGYTQWTIHRVGKLFCVIAS